MPNEMTAAEAAEIIEKLIPDIENDMTIYAYESEALHTAASYLRKIAAGEYKPVVHAHWELVSEGAQCNLVKCTHCGRSIAVARNVPLDEWRAAKPYCDQCGALMNGKSDDHA
ncbi:protein of unknown function [Ruminococcaceae bacterium BL-6]|nr:protein of unknown function [Ruminococcaceae bacterium BL-6]